MPNINKRIQKNIKNFIYIFFLYSNKNIIVETKDINITILHFVRKIANNIKTIIDIKTLVFFCSFIKINNNG